MGASRIANLKRQPTQDKSTIMKLAVALVVVKRTGESWFAACDCSAAVAARLTTGKAEEEEKASEQKALIQNVTQFTL